MDLSSITNDAIADFFASFFDNIISFFGNVFANIMGTSVLVLELPIVQNGIAYAQYLAFTLLVIKGISETISTYILHKNGDPDADPKGLVIGVAQATAVIATLPWIIEQLFVFGTKVASDVANLSTGKTGFSDWALLTAATFGKGQIAILIAGIIILIAILVIAIQATIRGAELALLSVIGPILALNLTSNNTNLWSSYFKQLIILNLTQGIQLFMLQGTFSLLTNQISSGGVILVIGWLWVSIKTPKYIQQFAHTTGFTGAVGGGAKQMGSMYLMRKMMTKSV